jgi:hypothetical protein
MAKVGEVFTPQHGRPAWYDGNDEDVPRGYYPIRKDGTIDFSTRLRWIDDAPGHARRNDGHFEVMRPEAGFGYSHRKAGSPEDLPEGTVVPLEAHAKGKAGLGARLARALGITYIIGRSRTK